MTTNAKFFLDLFCGAVPSLPGFVQREFAEGKRKEPPKSRRNTDFIESDLEAFLRQTATADRLLVNTPCTGKGGKIDYQRISNGITVASCELKGPARPKFLEDTENDWTWRVVSDIAKQLFRSKHSLKQSEHYVAVLLYGAKRETRPRLEKAFMPLLHGLFHTAEFSLAYGEATVKHNPMTVLVMGVKSRSEVRIEPVEVLETHKQLRPNWAPSPNGYFDGFMWRLTLYTSSGMGNKQIAYEGPSFGRLIKELEKAFPGNYYQIHLKNTARPRARWAGETSGVWSGEPLAAPIEDLPSLTSALQ
jgi:hypothetical protein